MSHYSRTGFDDVLPGDSAFAARRAEQQRLCTIIESEQSTVEQKYDALIELAHVSGILLSHELADAA